jgi:hypothetical protein
MKVVLDKIGKRKLSVVLKKRTSALPKNIVSKIERHWSDSISGKRKLFRGSVLCAVSIEKNKSSIRINVAESDYAHYLATLDGILPKKYNCRSVYTSIILYTTDNFLVLGEMDSHNSVPGQIQCPGGGITMEDLENGFFDFKSNAVKELAEEFYLDANDPAQITYFELKFLKTGGDINTIGIMFEARTNFTKNKFEEFFKKKRKEEIASRKNPEFKKLVFVYQSPAKIKHFLKNDPRSKNDYLHLLLKSLQQK